MALFRPSPEGDGIRGAQIVLVVLLAICAAQTVFWTYDEVRFTREVRHWQDAVLEERVRTAQLLLARGVEADEVRRQLPDLAIDETKGSATVPAEQRQLVHAEVDGRIRRFVFEGAFFFATLLAGMVILVRALSSRARLVRLQQNFLAAVTHELKSPLASIRLLTETLLLRDPPAEGRRKKLSRVLVDVDRLDVMVCNILEARRLDEAGPRGDRRELRLVDVVESVVDEVGMRLGERALDLQTRVDDEIFVVADPAGVRSIVRNLVDNAVKATEERENGKIEVRAFREENAVVLEVEDDGRGFPPAESSRLFDRFYRVGDELRRSSTGTGLGLYLVRRCAERDGGRVEAVSAGPESGASFRVRWPTKKGRR